MPSSRRDSRRRAPLGPLALGGAALLSHCTPSLSVHASRITAPRVVAVRAEPPEALPGDMVTFHALVATPDGAVTDAPIDWAFCELPRATDESTTVSSACLGSGMLADGGTALLSLDASGHTQATATLPMDACQRVGPQVPPVGANMVRQRPPDPDITGGYQLPLRLELGGGQDVDVSFARERIRCELPDVSINVARAYGTQYRNNQNPAIAEVLAVGSAGAAALDPNAPLAVAAGAQVPFNVVWDAGAAEAYVLVDPVTRQLANRTENLEVTWFTNGGYFDHDRTGPGSDPTVSSNVLHLDTGRTGAVTVWVVLRDDRGGVAFATFTLTAS